MWNVNFCGREDIDRRREVGIDLIGSCHENLMFRMIGDCTFSQADAGFRSDSFQNEQGIVCSFAVLRSISFRIVLE
jgi:hypothetical protein